jgi:AcrR family transcriptional regulator
MADRRRKSQRRGRSDRPLRADAQRNLDRLLRSAMEVFTAAGVDAPVRQIAEKAGVGIGTVYRHFPQRSDLIAAVFRREVDACAEAAAVLATEYQPGEALARWMQRYVDFISAKRGLAVALHSGNPAYDSLPAYFQKRLRPALKTLLERATAAGQVRAGVEPNDLLQAAASLCAPAYDGGPAHARRMVALLADGLRYGARP